MMPALFHGAQIDMAFALICDLKAQNLGIEFFGRSKVLHVKADMAKPDCIEIRV